MLLIMLEHPNINATSLIRAKLEDDNGRVILLSPTGETDGAQTRITVNKPRALDEKSVRLSPIAEQVINFVLDWTRLARDELKVQGRLKEAKQLWVGINRSNFNLLAFSHSAALYALKLDSSRGFGVKKIKSRSDPFVARHACLEPWASKITFKALRVNSGVLTYLKTGGDLVATARIFGHKHINTTISNYVPKPLRLAMYERQIRRHQNSLIISSINDENILLKVSDFKTKEDLHAFLVSQPITKIDVAVEYCMQAQEGSASIGKQAGVNDRVIIYDDADALAVAILYREHLRNAPPDYTDKPDKITGVAPRFWMRLVDALMEPLPLAMENIRAIMQKAKGRVISLKSNVVFPRFDS
jgi:hypothetical protein